MKEKQRNAGSGKASRNVPTAPTKADSTGIIEKLVLTSKEKETNEKKLEIVSEKEISLCACSAVH